MTSKNKLIEMSEFAKEVGVTEKQLYDWAEKGYLKPVRRIGHERIRYYSAAQIDEACEIREKLRKNQKAAIVRKYDVATFARRVGVMPNKVREWKENGIITPKNKGMMMYYDSSHVTKALELLKNERIYLQKKFD